MSKDDELREAIAQLTATTTELAALLGGLVVNGVLETWSGVFPAGGVLSRDFPVAAGAVYVRNGSDSNTILVSSSGPVDGTPSGVGTFVVAAGQADTVPVASRQVTLYGTAGETVSFVVFTAGPRPVAG